ncbi:MAG: efflux RND transporter periplasmic adaptor subunit [Candidatus Saganbacteria bacterium]|nr:efflux RND transporter periplasmic adaptor subunit [Candidatus Saganbacteria bacterium]
MFKKYKWLRWVAGILALIIVVWGIKVYFGSLVSIKVFEVKIGEIIPAVNVSGEIKGTTASLSSKTIGSIGWIGVKEGDAVKKGRVLAKMDNYDTAFREYDNIKNLFESGLASKNQLDLAKIQYENSCFISPINGIATLVANKVGESLSPGMAFISVVDPMSSYAEVQIDESDVGDVKVGQAVNIFCDAYPNEVFTGKLANIGEEAELKKVGGRIKLDEEDKIFRGKVSFDDRAYKLKIGMTISADIVTEKKNGILIIPREAVFSKEDKQEVYLIKKGGAKETVVTIGLKDSENVEVKNGLKEKDLVTVTNLDKLKNGSRIKIEKNGNK